MPHSMPSSAAVQCQFLDSVRGYRLAYQHQEGAGADSGPGFVFLCGFHSDMGGTKAEHLAQHCAQAGIAFTRFDYFGHGQSDGAAHEGSIGQWLADAREVLERCTTGPQILVGSSMGGWLAVLLAMACPDRVVGLVGIASAPDFTEALLWDKLTEKQQKQLARTGRIDIPSAYGNPYPITMAFLEESTQHFLLDKPSIPIHCPVALLHGMNDADVPFEFSMALNEKIESKHVSTRLIPDGDHRLSTPRALVMITKAVERIRGMAMADPAGAVE